MPDSETKNAPLVARSKPPIIGLVSCLFLAAVMLFLAYALYHTAGYLGGGTGVGGMRVPPGEHSPGGVLLGWLLGLLFVFFLSLLPWIVQSLLALISGLFLAFVFLVILWARIKKPIQLEIDEKGIAYYGLFINNSLGWNELLSVKKANRFIRLEIVITQRQRKVRSIVIKNVDIPLEEILAAIRQYRPDLVPESVFA